MWRISWQKKQNKRKQNKTFTEIKHLLSLQVKSPLEHLNSKCDPIAGEMNEISGELLAGEMGEFRQTPSRIQASMAKKPPLKTFGFEYLISFVTEYSNAKIIRDFRNQQLKIDTKKTENCLEY